MLSIPLSGRVNQKFPGCSSAFELKHVVGEGVGIDYGYTFAKYMLYSRKDNNKFYPFFDFRSFLSNEGHLGGSLGFGGRFQLDSLPFIAGANVYYDVRAMDHRVYYQLGVGLEALNFYGIDVSLNGYFPIEHKKRLDNDLFLYDGGYFVRIKPYQFPQCGTGLILGRTVNLTPDFGAYFSLEGYYYNSIGCEVKTVVGGRGAMRLIYKAIRGGVSISQDHIFGTNIQGEIGLFFSFGGNDKKNRWIQRPFVNRNDTIAVMHCTQWRWNYASPPQDG